MSHEQNSQILKFRSRTLQFVIQKKLNHFLATYIIMAVPSDEQEFNSAARAVPASPSLDSDDIWASDSGPEESRSSAATSDIPKLRREHHTAGYREAIAISKDQYIQEGFDSGYPYGSAVGLDVGWILGILQGLGLNDLERAAKNDLSPEILFSNKYYKDSDELARPKFENMHPEVIRWKERVETILQEKL